jgi:soluble lytic murein transglycosylase-like protein
MTAAALQAGWPEDVIPDLLSVAWCESRFRPDATNHGALGLMQIMSSWFTWLGIDVAMAADPVTNLKVAQYIYTHDIEAGYQPWASWACKPAGLPANVP